MLVLSRKRGQSIELAELDVVIRVISLKKSRVQLGIDAPPQITINRPETQPAVDEEGARRGRVGDVEVDHIDRLQDELARAQRELAALAELACPQDRETARGIAAESTSRLEGIKRTLRCAMRDDDAGIQPIGDFVKVRTEVLESLRDGQTRPSTTQEGSESWVKDDHCVRQSSAGFSVA